MYLITLSTIPPRFGDLEPTLCDLLAQRPAPEAVILYVPRRYRRFPDYDGTLPRVPKGVTLRATDDDLGPATKILPAVAEHAGQEIDILYGDDDQHFRPDWARTLLAGRARHSRAAITLSGYDVTQLGLTDYAPRPAPRPRKMAKALDLPFHLRRLAQNIRYGGRSRVPWHVKPPRRRFLRSGFVDIAEGYAGVLVRPSFFPAEVFDIPLSMWMVDDIWLSGQMARQGVPVWLQAAGPKFGVRETDHAAPLARSVIEGADRATANRRCADYLRDTYGVWKGRPGLP